MDSFGYVRVAAGRPAVRPGDVKGNLESIRRIIDAASSKGVEILVLPELCITGATCGDLFFQGPLLNAARAALAEIESFAKGRGMLIAAGLPVMDDGKLFNAVALIDDTGVIGFSVKCAPQGDARHFASASLRLHDEISYRGRKVRFASALSCRSSSNPCLTVGVAVGADIMLGGSLAPSASIVVNPFAIGETAGSDSFMRAFAQTDSARNAAAYIMCGAGSGESTSSMVFGGGALVVECGRVLAQNRRFERGESLAVADVDVEYLEFRRRAGGFGRARAQAGVTSGSISAEFGAKVQRTGLERPIDPHPFIPADSEARRQRCAEVFEIQTSALMTRLEAIGCRDVVIGLSGGLDSALALLVAAEAFKRLGLDAKGLHVLTMPGFGTSGRTKGNAELLSQGLGLALETVDITPLVRRHFADIGHDESVRDVTYENAQARARTYVLMDRANQVGGIVVGTGDLSELALGWCTFNGDHMSMYGVNAGVPKTLIRHMAEWYARERGGSAGKALLDILATPVSPELLPASANGEISQKTEDKVGPYELHDFFLYHFIGRGASKGKIQMLAEKAFCGTYDAKTVSKWLGVFMHRFFSQQFKRSCSPDGPKVGRISLAPSGDWIMPSDAVMGF